MVTFIFVALTTYQLMLSDIYARRLCEKGLGDVTVISVEMNVTPAGHIPYQLVDVPKLSDNVYIRTIERIIKGGGFSCPSELKGVIRKKDQVCIFVFNDREDITDKVLRTAKKKHSSIAVLLDEGIGTYADVRKVQLTLHQRLTKLLYRAALGLKLYRVIGDNPFIGAALVSSPDLYSQLKKAATQKVFKQDRRWLYSQSEKFLNAFYPTAGKKSEYDVMCLGQPFFGSGDINSGEKDYICRVIDMIPADKSIVIKPHPRDKKGKYDFLKKIYTNVHIIEEDIATVPLECLIKMIGVKIIIGYNSSSLINIANCFPEVFCCMMYHMPGSEEMQRFWGKQMFFASYDESMFSSIYDNLFIPETELEFRGIFDYSKNSIPADKPAENVEFDKLIDYCIGKLNEKHEQ